MPDLTSLPAWGIFAISVLWLVFQFLDKWQKRQLGQEHKRAKRSTPPPKQEVTGVHTSPPTADQVAAVIRDQSERAQILELLRSQQATSEATQTCLARLSSGFERLSHAEENQTAILSELRDAQERTSENVAKLLYQPSTH